MALILSDIKNLVALKESHLLEVKATTGQLTRGMESGCAFMNSQNGGYLLFGITDNGDIVGQEVSDKTKKEIANSLKKFEPTIFVDAQYIAIGNNKFVIAIYFKDTLNRKPYLFDGRAYIKIESTTSVMSQEAYNELLVNSHKEQFRWEAFLNKNITIDMFDKERIIGTVRLGIENGRLPESTIENMNPSILLHRLDLVENGVFKNASAVLFANQSRGCFPQCKLRLARFKGINRFEFIDSTQVESNVFDLFDAAMSFIFKHLSLSGKIEKTEREEALTIPYRALREAVANAFCHRDYSQYGGSVGIPNNPLIANVFYLRKMIESWGRGLELMYSECKNANLPTPLIIDNNGEIIVTFYFTEQVTEQVGKLIQVLSAKELGIKEILGALNLRHRPTLLYDYIQPAIEKGLVEQTHPQSPKSPNQKYRLTEKGAIFVSKSASIIS